MSETPNIPDGGVALAEPQAGDGSAAQDQRATPRDLRTFAAKLIALGSAVPIECFTDNVSESGFYLRTAADSGLAVGQRFEVALSERGDSSEAENLAGDGCYATVVRTDQLAGDPTPQIGAAFRFDQPLFL